MTTPSKTTATSIEPERAAGPRLLVGVASLLATAGLLAWLARLNDAGFPSVWLLPAVVGTLTVLFVGAEAVSTLESRGAGTVWKVTFVLCVAGLALDSWLHVQGGRGLVVALVLGVGVPPIYRRIRRRWSGVPDAPEETEAEAAPGPESLVRVQDGLASADRVGLWIFAMYSIWVTAMLVTGFEVDASGEFPAPAWLQHLRAEGISELKLLLGASALAPVLALFTLHRLAPPVPWIAGAALALLGAAVAWNFPVWSEAASPLPGRHGVLTLVGGAGIVAVGILARRAREPSARFGLTLWLAVWALGPAFPDWNSLA